MSAPPPWPNVPACYGWLSLTRRGEWRLGDGRVSHGGLAAFINRHYGPAGDGNWIVRNGPQTVFVSLDYTPWVWRLAEGNLLAHTGVPAGTPGAAWLDGEGNLLLATSLGIGLLDDRDLAALLPAFCDATGHPLNEEAMDSLLAGTLPVGGASLNWGDARLPLGLIDGRDVPARFGFNPAPIPTP